MNTCYVYGLYDPNTNELFYVGKGTDYRDTSHLKPSMWSNPKETSNPFLYYKIRSLMENNTPPVVKRLYENLSEEDAYRLENDIILEYGRRFDVEKGKLFNISEFMGGNKKGKKLTWSEDRRSRHRAECKKKRKYDPSYEELYTDYITNNMRGIDIAQKYEISDALVKKRLQHFGIEKPKHLQYGYGVEHTCMYCHIKFTISPSIKRKYCSKECYHNHVEKCK